MLSVQDTYSHAQGKHPSVYAAALQSRQSGWSVIPLIGGSDAETGKHPAVRWQDYQRRLSAREEIRHWFADSQFTAYGNVCGMISNLMVLDFDDSAVQAEFEQLFPQYTQTFTVQSGFRKTSHLYFKVDFKVKTCKVRGGDLKGEGSYIVGAGSMIAGQQWQVIRDLPLLTLQPDELEQILSFLALPKAQVVSKVETFTPHTDFAQLYREEVARTGERNNALFNVTRQIRDAHVSQQQAVDLLADLHAAQSNDDRERYETRYAEAFRTIASVYRQPPPQSAPTSASANIDEPTSQLPNSVREALLKIDGGVCFLRTYEGLLLAGFKPGEVITRRQMFTALRSQVSEYAIKIALHFTTPLGQRLFVQVDATPSPRPPTPADADPDGGGEKDENKCFVDQQKSSRSQQQRPAHRPPAYYLLPTTAELCVWLDVETGVSDAIRVDDIGSAKNYRKGLERELLWRLPGQYAQGWLADRLGVTIRSIYSYHQEIPIQSEPRYIEQELTWENYQQALPTPQIARRAGIDIRGRFIEDDQGKRYPAKIGIVQKLLGQKQQVWLKQRTFNYYWYGEDTETISPAATQCTEAADPVTRQASEAAAQAQLIEKIRQADKRMQAFFAQQAAISTEDVKDTPVTNGNPQSENYPIPTPLIEAAPSAVVVESRQSRKSVALEDNVEQLAQTVHQQTALNGSEHTMSLNNVRILIQTYGMQAVTAALNKMRWLLKAGKIINPAGFMVTASRISWRKQNGATALGSPVPRFRGEQGRQQPTTKEDDPIWRCLQHLILKTDPDYILWRAEFEYEQTGDWMAAESWLALIDLDTSWM